MNVRYDFTGKTAVVTGGANGISRGVAQRLASSGARVFVWDLVPDVVSGIESLRVDVTNASDIAAAIAKIRREGHELDILFNGAGYLGSCTGLTTFLPTIRGGL